jgi:proteasome lid subunit RPN8/RPN11
MRRLQPPWGALDPSRGPRVVVSPNLVGALLSYLSEAGQHERGGVLLGHRDKDATWVSMAIFPPQLLRDRIACSFDVGCLSAIHTAKDMLGDELTQRIGTIVGWVHSHPGLGLFLSDTDVNTLSGWRQLDPEAVAVVADPSIRREMRERIAWWAAPGRGRYVALDQSRNALLTIGQVALVAEALNQSADPNGRWDIVTARTVMRIMPNGGIATPEASAQDPGQTQPQDPEPRGNPGEQPLRDPGQESRNDE